MEQQLQELIRETKEQLFHYPRTTKKQDLKYIVKRILRPSNTPKRDGFFWPHAMLTQSLEEAGDLESLKKYFDLWMKKGLPMENIDHVMNGYSLLYVYEKTKEDKYRQAADKVYAYVLQYKKQMKDTFPYRRNHPTHVYVDGVGMTAPFLCRYGKLFGKKEAIDLGIKQIRDFKEYGMDSETGLPYHGYDLNTKVKYGIIGWGRAVGWLLLAMADCYEYVEKDAKVWLGEVLEKLLIDSMNYLRKDGYFSWQLSAKEGPKDTSATAMIGYALQKAWNLGVLALEEDSTLEMGETIADFTAGHTKSYLESIEQAIWNSVNRGKIMDCSGECEGFSQYPQVYGAYPWSLGAGTRFLLIRK